MTPLFAISANDLDVAGLRVEKPLPERWLDVELAEASAHAVAPGRFDVRLSRSGKSDVVLRGEVSASLELPCARCLGPSRVDVEGELALLLKPAAGALETGKRAVAKKARAPKVKVAATAPAAGEAAPVDAAAAKPARPAKPARVHASARARPVRTPHEYEFSSDEADVDEYDGERIVLDPFLREALLLELPSFPLCSEACPGIGAAPGSPGAPPAPASEPGRKNPFEALRYLMPDAAPDSAPRPGEVPPPRPSSRELKKAAKASHKSKPRIKASLTSRSKK